MELLDLRLRDFLDEIAGEGRTPGGGSVAALVTAMAAGLLAKVARGSTGTWPEAAGIAAQAESLRARAAPLAQADAEQYEAALLARGQSGEGQGARQDFALGQAYAKAAEPPLQIAQAASDVAQLALTVAQNGEAALWDRRPPPHDAPHGGGRSESPRPRSRRAIRIPLTDARGQPLLSRLA